MRVLCVLLSGLLLLTGCSAVRDPEQLAQQVQEKYAAAAQIDTEVEITANLDAEQQTYVISYDYKKTDSDTSAVMTVEAPESIAGITATVTGEDFVFSYADTQLECAMPDRKGLTPADAVTYLLDDLMHAQPERVWEEGELLALSYTQTDDAGTTQKEIYLDPNTGTLSEARIYSEGKQILQCVFQQCTLNGE